MRLLAPLPAAVVVLALLASGCTSGSEDDPSGAPSSTETSDDPDAPVIVDEIAEAAQKCTDVINARDVSVLEAGRDAAFDLIVWSRDEDAPTDAERADAVEAMSAARDVFAADLETLTGASDLEGWDAVLAPFEETISVLEARIAVLESDTWPPSDDDLQLGVAPGGADPAALEKWGMDRRDCAVVGTVVGPAPEFPEFAKAAANACRAIVDRRRVGDFSDAVAKAIEIVADVHQGETPTVTDAHIDALRTLEEEWKQTHGDLAAVPTDGLTATDEWDKNVQLAEDRMNGYGERLAALESGDIEQIEEKFTPGVLGEPGWDWEAVGLASRDCRSIEA